MEPRQYHINNSCVTIIYGDIMTSQAEVIASSDDVDISMGGGVSKSIRIKGGEIIRNDAKKKLPVSVGDVVVSTAGKLEFQKYIFHCTTLSHEDRLNLQKRLERTDEIETYIILNSINKCFALLHAMDINSIAFPCIGAGSAGIKFEKVAKVMAEAIAANLAKTNRSYNVELYLYDRYSVKQEMDYIEVYEQFAAQTALANQRLEVATESYETVPNELIECSDIVTKREDMTHQVFISYARKDREKVEMLTKFLDKHNISYWIDKIGIYSGDDFKKVIIDAIECAKVVIFVSSANSNDSSNVVKEISNASKRDKKIVPILLDNTPYNNAISYDIANNNHLLFEDVIADRSNLIASILFTVNK